MAARLEARISLRRARSIRPWRYLARAAIDAARIPLRSVYRIVRRHTIAAICFVVICRKNRGTGGFCVCETFVVTASRPAGKREPPAGVCEINYGLICA